MPMNCGIDIVVGCVFASVFGSVNTEIEQCELYLHCCSHICSVIYVNNVECNVEVFMQCSSHSKSMA